MARRDCVRFLLVVVAIAALPAVGHRLSALELVAGTDEMFQLERQWSSPSSAPGLSEDLCPTCEVVATALVKLVDNRTDVNAANASLYRYCQATFGGNSTKDQIFKGVCDAAAGFIINKLFGWLRGDTEKAWHDVPRLFCSFVNMCRINCCLTPTAPEQVHLSFADSKRGFEALRVTWVAFETVPNASVQWQLAGGDTAFTVLAATRTYTAGGWRGMIYSAVMTDLPLNSSFTYRVGSPALWSQEFKVRTPPANAGLPGGRPFKIAQIADMGERSMSNGTVDHLTSLAQSGDIDFILHIGDISYADGNQHRWDRFMRKIEGASAVVPYMTVPGNHECHYNFASYRARFWMPEITPYVPIKPGTFFWNEGYYDFAVNGVSFIMLDAEALFGGMAMSKMQLEWASAAIVNGKNNRAASATPWLITTHHRPLYCTNPDRDCGPNFAGQMQRWIEKMLIDNAVDVDISGHMHNYERTFPVARGTVVGNGSYVNAGAPVYILNGAGGNEEGEEHPTGDKPWSAFHSSSVGFGLFTMNVADDTATLKFDFYDSRNGTVLDTFTLTKPWAN